MAIAGNGARSRCPSLFLSLRRAKRRLRRKSSVPVAIEPCQHCVSATAKDRTLVSTRMHGSTQPLQQLLEALDFRQGESWQLTADGLEVFDAHVDAEPAYPKLPSLSAAFAELEAKRKAEAKELFAPHAVRDVEMHAAPETHAPAIAEPPAAFAFDYAHAHAHPVGMHGPPAGLQAPLAVQPLAHPPAFAHTHAHPVGMHGPPPGQMTAESSHEAPFAAGAVAGDDDNGGDDARDESKSLGDDDYLDDAEFDAIFGTEATQEAEDDAEAAAVEEEEKEDPDFSKGPKRVRDSACPSCASISHTAYSHGGSGSGSASH